MVIGTRFNTKVCTSFGKCGCYGHYTRQCVTEAVQSSIPVEKGHKPENSQATVLIGSSEKVKEG